MIFSIREVLLQQWLMLCPASMKKHWRTLFSDGFFLPPRFILIYLCGLCFDEPFPITFACRIQCLSKTYFPCLFLHFYLMAASIHREQKPWVKSQVTVLTWAQSGRPMECWQSLLPGSWVQKEIANLPFPLSCEILIVCVENVEHCLIPRPTFSAWRLLPYREGSYKN